MFGKDPGELVSGLRSSGADAVFNLSECRTLPEKSCTPARSSNCSACRTPERAARAGSLQQQGARQAVDDRKRDPHAPLPVLHCDPAVEPGLVVPLVVKPANEDGSAGITEDSVVADLAGLRRQVKWRGGVSGRIRSSRIRGRAGIQRRRARNGTAADPYRSLPPRSSCTGIRAGGFAPTNRSGTRRTPRTRRSPRSARRRGTGNHRGLSEITLACARIFGLAGYARVDFRMNSKESCSSSR